MAERISSRLKSLLFLCVFSCLFFFFFLLCFVLFLIVIKIKDLRECCFVTLLRKRHLCRNVCIYSCCVPRQGVQLCAKLACSRNSLCKLQKHDTQGGKKKLAVLSQGSATCPGQLWAFPCCICVQCIEFPRLGLGVVLHRYIY